MKAAPAKKKPKTAAANGKKAPATKAKTKAKPAAAATKAAKPPGASKSKPKRRLPVGAKRHPIFGLVYSQMPKEIDDLKQIKGVAKVIEAKLHDAGIYTFRQVVEWDDVAIDAFSEKLSFKGRIRNEGWQQQCAKFHEEKYGEKAG